MTKLKINHVYIGKVSGELYLCKMWNENFMILENIHGYSVNWNDNWFIDLGEL